MELGLSHPLDQTLELQLLSSLWSCGPLLDPVCVFESCGFFCFLRVIYVCLSMYILLLGKQSFAYVSYTAPQNFSQNCQELYVAIS